MPVDRETLVRLADSFPDFLSRARFVSLYGRITDIDEAINPHGSHRGAEWMTAAAFCAFQCNERGLKVALEAGADPDAGEPTALMQVAGHVREQRAEEGLRMVETLLAAGADVNHVGLGGDTALNLLSQLARSPSIAARLVEAGADCTAGREDKAGQTSDFVEALGIAAPMAMSMR
jgi:hypothetical protein